jgi:hypothetical protein
VREITVHCLLSPAAQQLAGQRKKVIMNIENSKIDVDRIEQLRRNAEFLRNRIAQHWS